MVNGCVKNFCSLIEELAAAARLVRQDPSQERAVSAFQKSYERFLELRDDRANGRVGVFTELLLKSVPEMLSIGVMNALDRCLEQINPAIDRMNEAVKNIGHPRSPTG